MAWCKHCEQDRPITRQIFSGKCGFCGAESGQNHYDYCRGPIAGAHDVCTFCNNPTFSLGRNKLEFERLYRNECEKHLERTKAREATWLDCCGCCFLLIIPLVWFFSQDSPKINPPVESINPPRSQGQATGVVNTVSGISVREKPGKNENKIIVIPNGTEFKILNFDGHPDEIEGKSGKWIFVEYSGKTGWVFDGFVKVNAERKN